MDNLSIDIAFLEEYASTLPVKCQGLFMDLHRVAEIIKSDRVEEMAVASAGDMAKSPQLHDFFVSMLERIKNFSKKDIQRVKTALQNAIVQYRTRTSAATAAASSSSASRPPS